MAGGTEDLGVPTLSRALLGQLHKINWSRHCCRADVRVFVGFVLSASFSCALRSSWAT